MSLKARCRYCKHSISYLYPFIEALTALTFSILYIVIPSPFQWAYFIFFSALIVTIRSDFESMLISRFVTIFLIPLGFLFSFFNLLPINYIDSIIGTLLGYLFLFSLEHIFFYITRKEGIGKGDLELLAFIGSFLGITGCWFSLLLGSITGSIFGVISMFLLHKKNLRSMKIPFGPFLAFGAIFFVLCQATCMHIFLVNLN